MKKIKEMYSKEGMFIITIIPIIFFIIVVLFGIQDIYTKDDIIPFIANKGPLISFWLFFLIICIYCWIGYYRNIKIEPKVETLHLLSTKDKICKFIDINGKTYNCEDKGYEEDKFYYVTKTKDYIVSVGEESREYFGDVEEKINYWLNLYTPFGNIEGIFLLPILYFILIFAATTFVESINFNLLLACIGIIYVIVYDFYKKYISSSKEATKKEEETFEKFLKVLYIIPYAIVLVILTLIMLSLNDTTSRLIFSPFYVIVLIGVIATFLDFFGLEKVAEIFKNSIVVLFFGFWFAFLTFATIFTISVEKNPVLLLATIPFWIIGIIIAKSEYKKHKRK